MTGVVSRVRAAVFAACTCAALVFGATSARAEVRAPACNDPFAETSCSTTSGCAQTCQFKFGAGSGSCSQGCCYCIWF